MRRWWLAVAIACLSGCYFPGLYSNDPAPTDSLPPSDATESPTGDLALIDGVVSIRPAQGDTWAIPDTNVVLGAGDRLWVDSVGHLEAEFGSTAVRMASETEVDLEK